MPLFDRIVQFTAWVESEKPDFAPKLLLMFLVGLYSAIHGHPVRPQDTDRRKGWIRALRNKWGGNNPGFDKKLEDVLKEWGDARSESHNNLYPRGWTEYDGGLTPHLNVWFWDQLSCTNEYLPIPLHDIFEHIEKIRTKYELPLVDWPEQTVAEGKPDVAHLFQIINTLDVIIQRLKSKLPHENPQYLNPMLTDLEDLTHTKQHVQNMLNTIGPFLLFMQDPLGYRYVRGFLAKPLLNRRQDEIDNRLTIYEELAAHGKANPETNKILHDFSKYWEKRNNPV